MATHPSADRPTYTPEELALAREGKLRLRTRDLADVLREIGQPAGPVSDAGTAALQDTRDDRV